MGLQRFPYEKFTGLNLRDAPTQLATHESPDAQNVLPIDLYGLNGVKSRHGSFQFLGPTAVSGFTTAISGGIYWPAKSLFIVVMLGDIYSVAIGGAAITKIYDAANVNCRWNFVIAPDSTGAEKLWCHGANGISPEPPQKWDGVTATTVAWAGTPPVEIGGATFPQIPAPMTYWRGRVVMGGMQNFKNRVHFSDVGNPEAPITAYGNNFVDFPDDDTSQGITDLVPMQESLLVFRERGVWQVFDANTFGNRRLVVGKGTGWRYQAVAHPNGRVYFFSHTDKCVYSMSLRGDLVLESDKISPALQVPSSLSTFNQMLLTPNNTLLLKLGAGIAYELVPFGGPGEGAWYKHFFAAGIPNYMFTGCEGNNADMRTLVGNATTDTTLQVYYSLLGTAALDGGVDPAPYWLTSWRPFISEEPLERVRRLHPVYGGQATLDVFAEMAPIRNPVAKRSFAMADTGFVGDRAMPTFRPETRGRYHAFKIKGVSGKQFEFDSIEAAFRGGKEHA